MSIDFNADLPTDATALAAERGEMVTRGADIVVALQGLPKASAKRAALVDEKTLLDRRLKRVNVALKSANRVANGSPAAVLDAAQGAVPASFPTGRDIEVLKAMCALLSGPLATRYWAEGVDDVLDTQQLADDADDIVAEIWPALTIAAPKANR